MLYGVHFLLYVYASGYCLVLLNMKVNMQELAHIPSRYVIYH